MASGNRNELSPMNRILIVDDNPEICRLLRRVSEGMGYEACILDNPLDFEPAYVGFEPNLIALDLQMPQMDGVEILRHLAALESGTAIVLMSGVQTRVIQTAERLATSLGLNIAGAVTKPIDLEEFERHLQRHYSVNISREAWGRNVTEADLARAIGNGELLVHYQPIISLHDGRVTGLEALARWDHPAYGLIGPREFIPLAEDTGLITTLTYRIMEQAAAEMVSLRAGNRLLPVAVNLSARMLDDLELPDRIDSILSASGFAHDRLTLEITESAAMDNPSRSMEILVRLCLKDIRLSIDDFGSGHSSLIHLYRLPYSEIKIDHSFVREVLSREEAVVIVRSIVNLAGNLGLRAVAEGVEDEETLRHLVTLGCDLAQGFLFCEPLNADDLEAWLQSCERGYVDNLFDARMDRDPPTELRLG